MARAFKFTVVMAVITAVIFVWSTAWAQTKTVQRRTATTPASKILVTQHPKVLKLKEPVSSKYIVAPKPLTRSQKQAYTREMLLGLGVKKVELPPQVAKVRLTPDAPRSGFNWYAIRSGSNFPFPRNDRPAYTYIGHGSINLHLERTIPGKLYMLDLAVGSMRPEKTRYIFSGAVEGEIKPQGGHLVAGFVAGRAISEITLKLEGASRRNALIYSIEVTQVN